MSVPLPDAGPSDLTPLLDALVYAVEARVRASDPRNFGQARDPEALYADVCAAREAITRAWLPVAA